MFKCNYELIEGMNLISMVNIVHYDEKNDEKRAEFKNTILEKKIPGIALDNGIALEVIDDSVRIIKAIKFCGEIRNENFFPIVITDTQSKLFKVVNGEDWYEYNNSI